MITPSQILLSAIIIFIIVRTLAAYKKGSLSPFFSFAWIIFWVFGLVLIFQQEFTITVANRLGISRGVDLVIYISLILVFYMIYRLLAKIENLERSITQIVRKTAIKDAQKKFHK